MPTTLTNGIQLPDKGSVDWYNSMQSNYNLIDAHLGNTDTHVTAEDKANWNSKQGSLSQAQLDAIAQVATNTNDIATLQSGKANASHTHSSSDITDIGDYATKQYVDNSISGLVDSAPAALDTLKELSTALNDDANFASTVATALSAKANSADLATVATSGSYNDLSNKPSIPTNTSDLNNDSGFVTLNDFDIPAKTSDLTNDSGFITSSDVPTGTSDLINDSNFVDTSNSAVASGITSAKVTSYDTHVADTDIHVTTADKNKWNNGVTQSYVFRYSSTALVASSTNSNTLLDNTDNLKVGDKVIDSNGVLFSITAIDTANSTFTVGSALIDLALDANVVHTSGNETVAGVKTFSDNPVIGSAGTNVTISNAQVTANKSYSTPTGSSESYLRLKASTNYTDSSLSTEAVVILSLRENAYSDGKRSGFFPNSNNLINLGISSKLWANVYATKYYYGGDSVEFSTKFVTTDTDQTISGNKTFSSNVNVYNSDSATDTANIVLKNSKAKVGTEFAEQSINFVDKNNSPLAKISCYGSSGNYTRLYITTSDSNNNSDGIFIRKSLVGTTILPTTSSTVWLGNFDSPFYNVQTKRVNGLTPSSLGMPDINNRIDISSYITDLTGGSNTYTPPANGWICIQTDNSSVNNYIRCDYDVIMVKSSGNAQGSALSCLVPVLANKQVSMIAKCTTLTSAYFIPCQGNV